MLFAGGKEENMKKRKFIGFRWIGNRTVIGIVCMIAAIGICFGIAPTVQKLSAGKTTILRVTRTVPRGSCLTEADVETVEVGSYGLSRDILRDKTAAVGKYATTDLYSGEYLLPAKLTANGADANGILESLTVGKKAISVTLGSFAQGLSGKLETGDIVSVIVYKAKEGAAVTPPELQYLRVITSTTSQGVDKANITDSAQPVTVTLLVNQAQAELLSAYEKSASMHFALEYRGDAETAAQYLAVQEEYFRNGGSHE